MIKSFFQNRKHLISILFSLTLLICCQLSCKSPDSKEVDYSYLLKDVDIPEKLYNTDQARDIIRKYGVDYPIPDNYIVPAYLKAGLTMDSAYSIFYSRNPYFYGKAGNDYITAVMNNPREYYLMITENKALREVYQEVADARKAQQDKEYMEQQAREAKKVIEEYEAKKAQEAEQ